MKTACLCLLLTTGLASGWLPAAEPARPGGMAGRLIDHFQMQRVPAEGVWFALSYASEDRIDGAALPARYAQRSHRAGSAIYVVATRADFSALHRLQTDETWHFYGGSPLEMLLLYPDGAIRHVTLGADVLAGQLAQLTVPRGVWQAAAPRSRAAGAWSFAGTHLAPGFEYADFEIGYRDELQRAYPQAAAVIARFTRAAHAARPASLATATPPAPPAADSPPGAAAAPAVFAAADVPPVTLPGGIELRELVGRVAKAAPSAAVSVAAFTLAPGATTGASYNRVATEVLQVSRGSGWLRLGGGAPQRVVAGSSIVIPAGVVHEIAADAAGSLEFLAIESPAFTPDDYVIATP